MFIFDKIRQSVKDRIACHKAFKLADALIECNINDYLIDYVDGKIILVPKNEA